MPATQAFAEIRSRVRKVFFDRGNQGTTAERVAGQTLVSLGIGLESIREEVMQLLSHYES